MPQATLPTAPSMQTSTDQSGCRFFIKVGSCWRFLKSSMAFSVLICFSTVVFSSRWFELTCGSRSGNHTTNFFFKKKSFKKSHEIAWKSSVLLISNCSSEVFTSRTQSSLSTRLRTYLYYETTFSLRIAVTFFTMSVLSCSKRSQCRTRFFV